MRGRGDPLGFYTATAYDGEPMSSKTDDGFARSLARVRPIDTRAGLLNFDVLREGRCIYTYETFA